MTPDGEDHALSTLSPALGVTQRSTGAAVRAPLAWLTMSAIVNESRCPRMCSPTCSHTPSKMHWPSCSQAPFSCGRPKSPGGDRAVDGSDDLTERDLRRRPCEHVTAAHATFRTNETGSFQGEEDLLEVRLGEPGAVSDVADRSRAELVGVQGQRQKCAARVVTTCRDLHGQMLPAVPRGERQFDLIRRGVDGRPGR